jgi:hypothetical protein
VFRSTRGVLVFLLAVAGLAAAAPAANAQSPGCPQYFEQYPMFGWPDPDHAEPKPYCPYIGYAVNFGEAEKITASQTRGDFAARAAGDGYTEDERDYIDWTGTDWKSVTDGVYTVNIMFYIPPWADDNGIGYTCRYTSTVSGTTGIGNWTHQLHQTTCSTYTEF